MTHPSQTTITRLLKEIQGGNRAMMGKLFALVYEELRAKARQQRARWHGDYTLNTTALVHEAYLRLVDKTNAEWRGRAHFLAVVAKAMHHILLDYVRRRQAVKRGGNVQKVSLEEVKWQQEGMIALSQEGVEALIVLEEALKRLERECAREAQVVAYRFFGGMTVEETAMALKISARTVKRDWAMAQAWLHREMGASL